MDTTDRKYWKWGLFYYNPDDSRIFPPKRNPMMGWTVNFANWKSITVFILALIVFYIFINFLMIRNA